MIELKGKKIVVLGLAKSGTTIAKILHRLGANVTVNDAKPDNECIEKPMLEDIGIKVICGGHPDNLINETVDMVVKNPGIPYKIDPIQKAINLDIPVITEVELAYYFAKAKIIAVTGSNGKTTTTTLIGEILKQADKNPIVAGNIGTVLSDKALDSKGDEVLVSELSSFQLKGTIHFRPYIALLINIYPAHLDYHGGVEDYIASKANIFKNQSDDDYAIINADCEKCIELVPNINSKVYYFSRKGPIIRGAYILDGYIYWRDNSKTEGIMAIDDIFLKGAHLENVLSSIVASKLYGVDFDSIKKVINNFKGVEHRVEYVLTTKNNITYYNDSKATNPQATISALQSFDKKIILLVGGLDRGIDFMELLEPFKENVKALITFGQTSEKLINIGHLAGIKEIHTVDNVKEAVIKSYKLANSGDIVLLSPACASWDMYKSFEERGSIFKEAVHRLV